ncbi:tyrosine-type recombinase/integrase [Pseudomonas nitroreducens]|uniref:tyrosine-type recombinase/integrase n=1 Tax=Pseudomonas nitroreducens TaxID=46680 RepID=UPI0038178DB0
MKVIKVPDCCIAISTVTQAPVLTDVFLILDDLNMPLWHENLFMIEASKEFNNNTCKAYATDLLSFSRMNAPMGGWSAVTDSVMTGYFVGDLIQSRRMSESSVLRHTSTLKRFYNWLFHKGYIAVENSFNWNYKKYFIANFNDYSATEATQHSHHSTYISPENHATLLEQVKSESPFHSARDRLCLQLGYLAGTRAVETLRINAQILNKAIEEEKKRNKGIWATTSYTIIGKRNKQRELEIPPALCCEIGGFLRRFSTTFQSPSTPLVCQANGTAILNEKHASYVFSRAHQLTNLTRKGHQGYHALRKSFATNLVKKCHEDGLDPWVVVPRRLGHEDAETTMGYIFFEALLNGRSKILAELRMMHFKGLRNA